MTVWTLQIQHLHPPASSSHYRATVGSEPQVVRWHFMVDNLNTHCSESLVRRVAEFDLY